MRKEDAKILIVEDDPAFVQVLTRGLHDHGFRSVESAADGEEGLQKAIQKKPDLVILDLILPKMRGEDFLRKLRAHPDIHATAVLIVSQLSDYEKILEGIDLGVKGYIVKSDFSLERLLALIEQIVKEFSQEHKPKAS